MKNKKDIRYLTRLSILLALVIMLTLFNIGNIPVGPVVATIYQVPVVVGAVLLGTKAGAILGGAWGLLCFLLALFGQTTDVVALGAIATRPFSYFVVAFVPRLLVGLISGILWKIFSKTFKKNSVVDMAATGVLGSLVNTIGYLGLLVLLFKDVVASECGIDVSGVFKFALSVAVSNGLVEAVVCGILTVAICKAVMAFDRVRENDNR